MSLVFIENTHEYQLDGVKLISVTQVLKEAGLSDFSKVNPELLERAANFGTAVHKACQLSALGTLDNDSLDPRLLPYLNQYRAFCRDFEFNCSLTEHQVFNKSLGVAGTIDQIGMIKMEPTIVDLKTGHFKQADVIQASAYAYLYPVNRVLIVYLTENSYKVTEVKRQERKRCEGIFLSALNLYNYRRKEKLL